MPLGLGNWVSHLVEHITSALGCTVRVPLGHDSEDRSDGVMQPWVIDEIHTHTFRTIPEPYSTNKVASKFTAGFLGDLECR